MLKVSGYWLIATSIIHVLVGLLVFNEPRKSPATDGSMQSLPIPLPYFDREDAFWFMMATHSFYSWAALFFGLSSADYPPAFLGWTMLCNSWMLYRTHFRFLAADTTEFSHPRCLTSKIQSAKSTQTSESL